MSFGATLIDEDEDGNRTTRRNDFAYHTCTLQELGLAEESVDVISAYPTIPTDVNLVKAQKNNFFCLDSSDLEIYGNAQQEKFQYIKIEF